MANWPGPKVLVFVCLFFSGAASGAENWATLRITGVVLYLSVWIWIEFDQRQMRESRRDVLAMVIFAPIAVPFYLIETRGSKRGLIGIATAWATVVLSALLGSNVPNGPI